LGSRRYEDCAYLARHASAALALALNTFSKCQFRLTALRQRSVDFLIALGAWLLFLHFISVSPRLQLSICASLFGERFPDFLILALVLSHSKLIVSVSWVVPHRYVIAW
jgi:hypothetical protein